LEGKSESFHEVCSIYIPRIPPLPKSFLRVLEQIQGIVEKHASTGPTPASTLAKLGSRIRKAGKDAKRSLADQEEIRDLNRRLQEVVEEFQVGTAKLALENASLMPFGSGRDSHERRAIDASSA
jgi:hypothetical protein